MSPCYHLRFSINTSKLFELKCCMKVVNAYEILVESYICVPQIPYRAQPHRSSKFKCYLLIKKQYHGVLRKAKSLTWNIYVKERMLYQGGGKFGGKIIVFPP